MCSDGNNGKETSAVSCVLVLGIEGDAAGATSDLRPLRAGLWEMDVFAWATVTGTPPARRRKRHAFLPRVSNTCVWRPKSKIKAPVDLGSQDARETEPGERRKLSGPF